MREHQEREYPLRKGSVIRTEEGILFSRCSPGSIPITTDPEVEYNEILDAYGDSLDRNERIMTLINEMKPLFEAWNIRSICEESLESYEQGVMLELVGMCEELITIKEKSPATGTEE